MTVRHHPEDALLLAYAAGGLDAAMSLILATHLTFCARCRRLVARQEQIGGALLEDISPVAMDGGALAQVMARLDEPAAPERHQPSNDNTPAPLRAVLGHDLSDVRWRKMGPHLGYVTLYRQGPVAVRLLRGAPGSDVGSHSHHGMEYTLVLRGGYTDATGNYGPGDLQVASGELQHNPIADPGEDCINLSVTTGPLRFDNPVQKIVARLFGF
ncbi:MAG TPA: ChrR family anti-sigma-E factor [Rhizomicrobium sp.]|nr:ChrR family anti-sigma-E factor [Rhizomicrobium sp.]